MEKLHLVPHQKDVRVPNQLAFSNGVVTVRELTSFHPEVLVLISTHKLLVHMVIWRRPVRVPVLSPYQVSQNSVILHQNYTLHNVIHCEKYLHSCLSVFVVVVGVVFLEHHLTVSNLIFVRLLTKTICTFHEEIFLGNYLFVLFLIRSSKKVSSLFYFWFSFDSYESGLLTFW